MLRVIGRRLLLLPLSLLLVAAVTFAVLRLTGNPVDIFLDANRTQEQVDELTARLHLDQPIPVQFLIFLGDLAQGRFGESLQSNQPALEVVLGRLGATAELAGTGLAVALVVGVIAGLVCAVWRDRVVDVAITSIAVAGQSMPSFWLGLLLIQVFALQLHLLPTSGMGGPQNLVLPAVTLAAFLLPNIVLITRASVLELAGENFVIAARSRGLSKVRTLLTHVLPNAFNPILSFLGVQIGTLIGGSIITETIFAWPGVGRLMLASISHRDVAVVEAGVLVFAVVISVVNLAVDLLQMFIDPRIRHS